MRNCMICQFAVSCEKGFDQIAREWTTEYAQLHQQNSHVDLTNLVSGVEEDLTELPENGQENMLQNCIMTH